MTELSMPWAGLSPGDAGPYTDVEWATLWRGLIGESNNRPNSGVLRGSGSTGLEPLKVVQSAIPGASVLVKPGAALVNGRFYSADADVTLAVAGNSSGNPRIDRVVLHSDSIAQTVRLAIVQGTPAVSPTRPALTQTATIWEIPLADLAVANGFSSIGTANITMIREYANAADSVILEDILNNSGGELVNGDVVIWDSTADRAVKTTTVINDIPIAGVWLGLSQNGEYGRVMVRGITRVKNTGSVPVTARGQYLTTSSVAKTSNAYVAPAWHAFARALEAAPDAAGYVLCAVNVGGTRRFSGCRYRSGANWTLTSGGAIAYSGSGYGTTYNVTSYDTDSYHENVTNPSRFVAPCPGKFRFTACLQYPANVTGIRQIGVRVNGATQVASESDFNGSATALTMSITAIYDMAAGDYFELGGQQNSGGNLTVTTVADSSPVVSMELVG